MARSMPLREMMHGDFALLAEGDKASLQRELSSGGQPIVVTVDPAGQVSEVWSGQGRGTPIVASADTPAEDIAASSSLLRELNREGAAIVVVSDDRPIGIVLPDRFAEYLVEGRSLRVNTLNESAPGDAGLAGDYTQSKLIVVCKTCGTRNALRSWVEGVTICANPAPPRHVLVRR